MRFAFALTLLFASAAPAAADDALRVVSWNVWGVRYVAPAVDDRLAAVADAVAPLRPDVVALQEVWEPEHGAVLRESLAAIGLPHVIHWVEDGRRAGLLVASRWPIEELAFEPFRMGGDPLVPWHVDYIADKGVALVRVHAPHGDFVVANTHLQAAYGAFAYTPVRVGQMLQLASLLDRVREPLVVAGDLNTLSEELGFRALVARGGLVDAAPGFGIDALLHRGGFRTLAHHRVLDQPTEVAGQRMRLSDHDALLVELALAPARATSPSPAWARVRDELRAFREQTVASWARLGGAYRLLGLLALAFVVSRWRRTRRVGHRHALRALALAALTLLYLGFAYGPAEAGNLDRILLESEREPAVTLAAR